jgi:hypothetical protein
LGLQLQRTFYIETPSEHLHQLEEKVEVLQDERSSWSKTEISWAGKIRPGRYHGAHPYLCQGAGFGEMNLDNQLALFESLRSRISDLDRELLDLAIRKRGWSDTWQN